LDRIRDSNLQERGWNVLRITHKEYKNGSKIELVKNLLGIN